MDPIEIVGQCQFPFHM